MAAVEETRATAAAAVAFVLLPAAAMVESSAVRFGAWTSQGLFFDSKPSTNNNRSSNSKNFSNNGTKAATEAAATVRQRR